MEEILLAKLCEWIEKLTLSPELPLVIQTKALHRWYFFILQQPFDT